MISSGYRTIPCELLPPLPVLATRLRLVPGKWLDSRNRAFQVHYDEREKLSKLYPADDARLSFKDGEWL
jgi:hypothetical protein